MADSLFATAGPPGAPGAAGPTGPAGPTGATGPQGPQGQGFTPAVHEDTVQHVFTDSALHQINSVTGVTSASGYRLITYFILAVSTNTTQAFHVEIDVDGTQIPISALQDTPLTGQVTENIIITGSIWWNMSAASHTITLKMAVALLLGTGFTVNYSQIALA